MSDETTEPVETAPVVDDQGNAEPVVPTDVPAYDDGSPPVDAPPVDVPQGELTLEEQVAALTVELADRDQHIDDLNAYIDSLPAPDGGGFEGVRTPALDAFEAQQHQGEIEAWERDTGLSYADTETTTEPGVQ